MTISRKCTPVATMPGLSTPLPADLAEIAPLVLGGGRADEDEAREVVLLGLEMLHGPGEGEEWRKDVGFFLVAWGVERIAAHRIASGDLGIDEAIERMDGEDDGAAASDAATAEYRRLVEEIILDTFEEFREFEMARLYQGHRGAFLVRAECGRQALSGLFRHPAGYGHLALLRDGYAGTPPVGLPGFASPEQAFQGRP